MNCPRGVTEFRKTIGQGLLQITSRGTCLAWALRQQTSRDPDTCLSAQSESNMLEQHVVNVRTHIHAMTEDPSNKERLYVTNEDIVKLASIGRDTVFAVTAPQGTSLIVPDPDKTAPGQPPQYRYAPSPAEPAKQMLRACEGPAHLAECC